MDSVREVTIGLYELLLDVGHTSYNMITNKETNYLRQKKMLLLEQLADKDELERKRQEKIDNFNRLQLIKKNIVNIEGETIDFTSLWINIGLKNKHKEIPILIKYNIIEVGIVFTFELPIGVSEGQIRDKIDEIAIFFETDSSNILIKKYKNMIDIVHLTKDIYKQTYKYEDIRFEKEKDLIVPIGYYLNNQYKLELLKINLSKDGGHSILISGCSSSGKSSVLRVILAHMSIWYTKEELELIIFAGSGDTDFLFLEEDNLIGNKIWLDINEIVGDKDKISKGEIVSKGYDGVLEGLQKEIEYRLKEFSKIGAKDIEQYRKKGGKMPYKVIVFDEYSYFASNEEKFKRLQLVIGVIAQTGRKVGFKVIISLQDAQNMYYTPAIKYNTPIKIGLKAMNEHHSKNICDRVGLEELRNVGEGKMYSAFTMPIGRDCYHFKGLMINKDNAKVNKFIKENKWSNP